MCSRHSDENTDRDVSVFSKSVEYSDIIFPYINDSEKALDFFTNIINSVADPVFVKNEKHQWVVLNDAFCRFTGLSREELIGKSDFDVFPREEAEIFWRKDDEVFKSGKENINEESLTDTSGRRHIISTKKTVFKDAGTGQMYLVGIIRDITAIKETKKKLREATIELKKQAITDEMTGLANRRHLYAIAEHQINMAKRNQHGLLVLYVDMDKLKQINDEHGHREGDYSIVEVANILKNTLRESDVIARVGGDEFVVLISGKLPLNVEQAIKRLEQAIDNRNMRQDNRYQLSISIGYACVESTENICVNDLISRADKSMYEQKKLSTR